MNWSESIAFAQPPAEVRLLARAPAQAWEQFLAEREQAAYERGKREAEAAAAGEIGRLKGEATQLQAGVLDGLRQAVPKLISETEDALVNLALEAAAKITAGMPIKAVNVKAVIREALAGVEESTEVTVCLHADDLALLKKKDLAEVGGGGKSDRLRLVSSPEVTRGGCMVKTRFGVLDARRETKLEKLRQTLAV